MFHWRKTPDRDAELAGLKLRIAALEAKLADTGPIRPDAPGHQLEVALQSLGRAVERSGRP